MTPEWINVGSGTPPAISWATRTEGDIVATAYARETRVLYAADSAGGIYAFDDRGEISAVTRGFLDLDHLVWADDGSSGAIVTEGEQVSRLNQKLKSVWSANLPGEVTSLAIDPYGHHLLMSLSTRKNFMMNWRNKRIAEFETLRPLRFIQFCATEPMIVGAADQGHLCCHELRGEEIWKEAVFSNVGDMRITGNAKVILIAGFNHGVQMYDSDGAHRGSYMVEGTPKLADCTFMPESIAVATIEKHLYWLDSDGEMKWATETPEEVVGLHCEPLGGGFILAMKSGEILRLDWATK